MIETFPPVHCVDDLQFVILYIQSGSFIRFQVDMVAQWNIPPLPSYSKPQGM